MRRGSPWTGKAIFMALKTANAILRSTFKNKQAVVCPTILLSRREEGGRVACNRSCARSRTPGTGRPCFPLPATESETHSLVHNRASFHGILLFRPLSGEKV